MTGSPRRGLTRRLLSALLPVGRRDEVLGDLDERLERRLSAGDSRAGMWYRGQALALVGWALRERLLDAWGANGMARGLWTDLRIGVRSLLRSPSYAVVAVATLAIGIGANTAVFSVVDGVLLRPLPYPEPHELLAIRETRLGQSWWSAAPVNALAWRERSRTLEDVAWGQTTRVSLRTELGDPEALDGVAVSANLFDLLGVSAALGRTFRPEEDAPGGASVAVLTHDAWVTRFGADRSLLGRALDLDGVPHTVVGVLPEGAEPAFLGRHEVLVPRVFSELDLQSRGRVLQAVGRLAGGTDFSAAHAEMEQLGRTLDEEAPASASRGWGVRLVPLKDEMVGTAKSPLFVLVGAVAFVLLVGCANLSNLMLARGSARRADLAVRASLGAGRARLVRQLLVEAGILATAGGVVGLVLAAWGTDLLLKVDPSALPRLTEVRPDPRMLAFTGLASVAAALLFGLLPAFRVSRVDLASAFEARGGAGGRGDARLRAGLVAAEVALVVALLVGAAMLMRSVRALGAVDPGFETADRLAVRFALPAARFPDPPSAARLVTALSERVRSIPGVRAAGTVTTLPLSGGPGYTAFHVLRSLPEPEPGSEPIGGMEIVGPGYFEAMAIPVIAGRTFASRDLSDGVPVAIVDRGVVERARSVADPLTDALRIAPPGAGDAASWREVVGVVGSVRYGLSAEPRPRVYVPEGFLGVGMAPRTLVVHVREGAGDRVIEAVRDVFREIDPLLPIERIERLDQVAVSSIARTRFQSTLLAVFAAVALGLGAVGVYGVVAYTVARRTRDVGVRLALGASRSGVLGRVVKDALVPVAVGLGLGLAGASGLTRVMAASTFGVAPLDPVAFGTAPAVLLAVAVAAAAVPALRASRIDPVVALRSD